MPAEGARGIKPKDLPYTGLLIMGNVGKHDEYDDGHESWSHSTSLHLPCLEPSPPEPTIGRLILVEDSPEDDCFNPSSGSGLVSQHSAHDVSPPLPPPSGSAPTRGKGSHEAQNSSNITNTAHRFPPNYFNFSRFQSARPSVPLIQHTRTQLHGQESLQLSFPGASSACPSPQAAIRRLASLRQPQTSNAKLISLGPHICEMDFTPCTDLVPHVDHKHPVLASFSTNRQSLEGPQRHSTRFAIQSGAMPVSNQAGARPIYQPQSSAHTRTAGVSIDLIRDPGALMKLDEICLPGYDPRRSATPAPRRTWYSTMLRSKTVIDPRKSDHTHRPSNLSHKSSSMGQQDLAALDESPPPSCGQRPQPSRRPSNLSRKSSFMGQQDLTALDKSPPPSCGQQPLPSRRPSNLSHKSSSMGQQDLAALDESPPPSCGQQPQPSRRPSNLSRKSSSMGQQDLAALDESPPPSCGQRPQPSRRPSNLSRKSSSLAQPDLAALDELSSSPPGQRCLPSCMPSKLGPPLCPGLKPPTIMDQSPPRAAPPLRRQASMKQVIGRWQASQSALKPEQMPMGGHVQHAPSLRQGSSSTRQNPRQRRAGREVGPDGEPVYREPLPKHRRSWISVYRTYGWLMKDGCRRPHLSPARLPLTVAGCDV
eukprot:gene24036-9614_t